MAEKVRVFRKQPFCWQEKTILRLIRQHCDEGSRTCMTLSVYMALSEVASNQGEEGKATISRSTIAQMAGISVRSVSTVLKDLESIGVITVKRRREGNVNLSSSYYLTQGAALAPVVQGVKSEKVAHNRSKIEDTKERTVESPANDVHSNFAPFKALFEIRGQYPTPHEKNHLKTLTLEHGEDQVLEAIGLCGDAGWRGTVEQLRATLRGKIKPGHSEQSKSEVEKMLAGMSKGDNDGE
jgi:hypothetical protein